MKDQKKQKRTFDEDQVHRLVANVGIELTIAGAEVLREQFGFSPEMIDRWMKATTARAKANREGKEG